MTEEENKQKLSILLTHWIEHNKGHAQDFKRWADKAKGFDGSGLGRVAGCGETHGRSE